MTTTEEHHILQEETDDIRLPINLRLLLTTSIETDLLQQDKAERLLNFLWTSNLTYTHHVLLHFEHQIGNLITKGIAHTKSIIKVLRKENTSNSKANCYKNIFIRSKEKQWKKLHAKLLIYHSYLNAHYPQNAP